MCFRGQLLPQDQHKASSLRVADAAAAIPLSRRTGPLQPQQAGWSLQRGRQGGGVVERLPRPKADAD
jgi:hypothetical protein